MLLSASLLDYNQRVFKKKKFSVLNYNKNGLLNQLLLAFLVYFIYSYFLKLHYVLGGVQRDEIAYLSDSLLLMEGFLKEEAHHCPFCGEYQLVEQ